MPKVSKSEAAASARQARQHNPLSEEYAPTDASFKQKAPKRKRKTATEDDENATTSLVDSAASKKILKMGRDLMDEEEAEEMARRRELGIEDDEEDSKNTLAQMLAAKQAQLEQQKDGEDEWEDEEEFVVSDDDEDGQAYDPNNEIEPVDLEAFNKFNPSFDDPLLQGAEPSAPRPGGTRNLADIILAKIAEHEAMQEANGQGGADGDPDSDPNDVPPHVVEVYTAIGAVMSRQNTGKLPKPFSMIAGLPLGMQGALISLTEPEKWTPYIAYAATRLFVSKSPQVALHFLNQALLPLIQDRIEAHPQHKLHPTLYRALKKALYKPAAFFKGIVFPMLESGCTMREAHIVSSVVARVSIPVLHSAAALMRLTEIAASKPISSWNTKGGTGGHGAGPVNWFIKVLIEKKYALPYKVIDALVFHFLRFRGVLAAENAKGENGDDNDDVNMGGYFNRPGARESGLMGGANLSREESLPLLWHQSFLAFAQRYRNDITEDQREALLDLLLGKGHRSIGPEIRRELLAGRGRGMAAVPGAAHPNGGDDTMEGVEIAA